MNKNDKGKSVIDINCFCNNCNGNIYIQPDTLKNKKCFIITVIDSSGNDEGNMWISFDQALQLSDELKILLEENKI